MIIHWYDQGSLPQPGCLLCVERTTNVATPWAQCVSPWFVSVSEDEPQKDPLEAFYRIAVVALSPGGTSHIIIDVTKKQEDFVRSCQLTDLRVYFVSQGRGVVTRNKPSGSHFIGITARKDLSDQLDAYPRPTAGSALYFVVLKVSLDINAAAEAKLLRKYEDDPDSKSPTDGKFFRFPAQLCLLSRASSCPLHSDPRPRNLSKSRGACRGLQQVFSTG
jgi:hypothetical protein